MFDNWRVQRRRAQEERVIRAIGMLRPSKASAFPISLLARMGPGSAHPVLARLEGAGRVVSEWVDGPYPRRRVYRVVEANRQVLS